MNKEEYYSTNYKSVYYRQALKELKIWKLENNINEVCVIHHRDDNEEVKKYNEEHYELWGFNLDGTFEYGKYVIFLTKKEHATHHFTGKHHTEETKKKIGDSHRGCKCYMFGKHVTEEVKKKLSLSSSRAWTEERKKEYHKKYSGKNSPMFGKKLPESHCKSISLSHYDYYKRNPNIVAGENNGFFGKHHTEETKNIMREKHKNIIKAKKYLYTTYKNNHGIKSWNTFQASLKSGDINFKIFPTSVFIKN